MLALNTRYAVPIRILFILVLLGACVRPVRPSPESPGTPEREVRAAWVTTVGALDWPLSYDAVRQRTSLGRIIENLANAGFNTLFFQVRGRGDAVYTPGMEPWSHVLTGIPGGDPGWDPLAFAVEEAHSRGMEIHAWFNTYLVRGMKSPPEPTTPPHVITAHRDWVRLRDNEWWLDPGEPEVQEYLTRVALDIVSRYDIDGLQMDYIRYPGRSFDDDATYTTSGRGVPRDRWRRENITRFLTHLKKELDDRAPLIKFGVTPIGIYRNPDGVRGLESFSDVFQDTYEWVRRGIVDYVAPQIYWPVGGGGRDPDFTEMVAEWRRESPGRHMYAGIASYKPEVLAQGTRPVEVARDAGADGVAFFRYGNIEGELPLGTVFSHPSLPPAMPWKDGRVPPAPGSVAVMNSPGGFPRVTWSVPAAARKNRFIAVYRVEPPGGGGGRGERLEAVLPIGAEEYIDSTAVEGDRRTSYAVSVVSRTGMESLRTGTTPVMAASPAVEEKPPPPALIAGGEGLRVGMPSKARGSPIYFLPFSIDAAGSVTVSVLDPDSGKSLRVFEGERSPGGYVVSLDLSAFGAGRYRCSVLAGGERVEREILVRE